MKAIIKYVLLVFGIWLGLVAVHEYGQRRWREGMYNLNNLHTYIDIVEKENNLRARREAQKGWWRMIFSKASLTAVDITRADKGIPALDNLHLTADGTTVAANGSCVVAVSPVKSGDRAKVPLAETLMIHEETISSETIREVLKGMPKDSLFSGTLEHCDYSGGKFTLTDGKRVRTVSARTYPREYIEYGKIFERVGAARTAHRVAVNLRRLVDVLSCIDKMFPDSSKNTAVYVEFTDTNDVILRVIDVRGKQRTIAVLRSYGGAEGQWPAVDNWEQTLLKPAAKAAHPAKHVHKIRKIKRK